MTEDALFQTMQWKMPSVRLPSDGKNWLFANTPKGASASAVVYSLVETTKANGLNVNKYLEYVLQFMSATDWRNNPEFLEEIMPWDTGVQKRCR